MRCKILLLVVALLASISSAKADSNEAWTTELLKLHYLGITIRNYQAEHGESAWPSFKQLIAFGGIPVKRQFAFFIDPKTNESLPWLYLPGGKPLSQARIILIAAPRPQLGDRFTKGKERRAVLWSDFRSEFIDEFEFQELLKGVKR